VQRRRQEERRGGDGHGGQRSQDHDQRQDGERSLAGDGRKRVAGLLDDGVGASLRRVDVTTGGEAWSESVDGDGAGRCCRPAKGLGSPSPKGRAHYMRCVVVVVVKELKGFL